MRLIQINTITNSEKLQNIQLFVEFNNHSIAISTYIEKSKLIIISIYDVTRYCFDTLDSKLRQDVIDYVKKLDISKIVNREFKNVIYKFWE